MSAGNYHTLNDARAWLREQAQQGGAPCPCCHRLSKVYRRKISLGMVLVLDQMASSSGASTSKAGDWVDVASIVLPIVRSGAAGRGGDFAKLRHWGLIEQPDPELTPLPADTAALGLWRATSLGVRYLLRQAEVPRYALVHANQRVGFDGPTEGIAAVLRDRMQASQLRVERSR